MSAHIQNMATGAVSPAAGNGLPASSVYLENGAFFENFAKGIPSAHWYLMRARWGQGNHGVLPENAACTADGILVLTARGDRYTGDFNGGNGQRTGAVLTSRRRFGPGSFEVRMKVLPEMGACSAIWTYYNDGVRNHEIDIELPGNTRNFEGVLCTNWLTEQEYASQYVPSPSAYNDGKWHTYRFDWHTDPRRVDYAVDGKTVLSVDHHIPTAAGLFNVGVWFPWEWCGEPDFDTAQMLVDWIRYEPYDEPYEP